MIERGDEEHATMALMDAIVFAGELRVRRSFKNRRSHSLPLSHRQYFSPPSHHRRPTQADSFAGGEPVPDRPPSSLVARQLLPSRLLIGVHRLVLSGGLTPSPPLLVQASPKDAKTLISQPSLTLCLSQTLTTLISSHPLSSLNLALPPSPFFTSSPSLPHRRSVSPSSSAPPVLCVHAGPDGLHRSLSSAPSSQQLKHLTGSVLEKEGNVDLEDIAGKVPLRKKVVTTVEAM
ncbi:hypothetical protein PIB30_074570 [Stylosanthes scabra]|uniref:Uncharacterized protein n=1 Tax=Stylosanthes scabra TaxID=79078 RepID=A0ABU6YM97_9FABA|nr:hypothetical protein [Stylosanthes scabra]